MDTISQIVPSGMFRLLDSKNRDVFAHALLIIYERINTLPVVKKEGILNDLEYQFGPVLLDNDDELEEDGESMEDIRSRARTILNTLCVRGWIREEPDLTDYSTRLYIPPYAFPFLTALKELLEGKEQEYGSLIYRSYTALYHASRENGERDTLFDAIFAANDACNELKRNLVQFYNSLHTYRVDLDKSTQSNEILKTLLDEFHEKAKKEYAPIKTVDSYSRYRNPIIQSAYLISGDDSLLNEAARQMIKKGRAEDPFAAAEKISDMLRNILTTYEELSSTMANIENEYRVYIEKAEQKIKAMLSLDRSVSGNLKQILKLGAPSGSKELDQEIFAVLNTFLPAQPIVTASNDLLYKKPAAKSRPKPPNKISAKKNQVTEEQKRRVAEELQREAKRRAEVKRMLKAVTDNSEQKVTTSQIPVLDEEDYKKLYAMVKIIADEEETEFSITEVKSGKTIRKGNYLVPVLTIERKK